MSADHDWSDRERRAREALARLAFLEGHWVGEGTAYGAPVRGRLVGQRILGDTFLETRETLFDAGGKLDHEDLTLYRFDTGEGHYRVLHLMAPAWRNEVPVVPTTSPDGPGLSWVAGPQAPRVEIRKEGEVLRVQVTMPDQDEPVVDLCYRPA